MVDGHAAWATERLWAQQIVQRCVVHLGQANGSMLLIPLHPAIALLRNLCESAAIEARKAMRMKMSASGLLLLTWTHEHVRSSQTESSGTIAVQLATNGIMASIAVGNTCATAKGSKSDGSMIVLRQLQNSSECTSGASFSFGKQA